MKYFAPLCGLPIACLVLFLSLFFYSNTFATIGYGTPKTETLISSTNGYYLNLTMPEAVNFSINGTNINQTIKADARITVSTNSVSGHKLYVSSEQKSLKTSDGLNELIYGNTSENLMMKSDLEANSWGIFTRKNGQEYILPLCKTNALKVNCLVSESAGPATDQIVPIEYATHVNTNTKPGVYSISLVYSAVINTNSTMELSISGIENAKVPLEADGHSVLNQNNKRLKHRFKLAIPLMESEDINYAEAYKKYKVTAGGADCKVEPSSLVKTADGLSFSCIADFNTVSPLNQIGQSKEIVVETLPYGYVYSKQNAVEFIAAEQTFNYTGAPQEMTAPMTGKYRIQAMGASGGARTAAAAAYDFGGQGEGKSFLPGLGGYAIGYKNFNIQDKAMVLVGGRGESANNYNEAPFDAKGGYNGGGNGSAGFLLGSNPNQANWGGAGGGGSSDVRPYMAYDYVPWNIQYRPDGVGEFLNAGPWATLDYGAYQTLIEVENLPDSDFNGATAYYDYGAQPLQSVYVQKHGNFISVYFDYPVGSPPATHLPGGVTPPAIEVRLKVNTSNTTARIKSFKFYKMSERFLVAGGGAGGALCATGGNGGGPFGNKAGFVSGGWSYDYSWPDGGTATTGGGNGFGGSAPTHGTYQAPYMGRAGAGGGWMGGFAETRNYSPYAAICAGAGGGSGYVGGVTDGYTIDYVVAPWNTIQPVDQNGVVLFKIMEYEGGVE